ncbi:TatD-related deoxyribonuclease [Methanothermus fervidus DSM 2088]|uniref:TatD-related deoxyribonuclease n=1 Tax=Methanothermus fervidus (strain ATCC 43054 / DSM 2088 / JCM 10308 / V24 S) TaxID=523846 RepID=E3GY51_METFV|nr:TatD family hydrolase [Methanothermus fervidus]ADP77233.1 TatD-related deoxyribonuclease [Methanothermus fervidus DSM 2088]
MIDSHIHADTRPYEDFEMMAISGIEKAITCAHDPLPMKSAVVTLEHISRLQKLDVKRAQENGIDLYVAAGIHPRAIPTDYEKVINKLPSILNNPKVVAIGEIGLEKGSKEELKIFKEQIKLADKLKVPVIIHTPRKNKEKVIDTILSLLSENLDESLAVIDHIDDKVVDKVVDRECMLGLTIQPGKLTIDKAITILEEYGVDKFMLNSDMSSAPSDPLSVPKTVHKMRLKDFNDSEIAKVSYKNAEKFFKL